MCPLCRGHRHVGVSSGSYWGRGVRLVCGSIFGEQVVVSGREDWLVEQVWKSCHVKIENARIVMVVAVSIWGAQILVHSQIEIGIHDGECCVEIVVCSKVAWVYL